MSKFYIWHRNFHYDTLQKAKSSERQSRVFAPVRRDNPRALASGLSTVQLHKPCSIPLVP